MAAEEDVADSCLIHFSNSDGELRPFTHTTYNKFISTRNEWLNIRDEESEATDIARKVAKVSEHFVENENKLYHQKCYKYFTDVSKIERARKRKEKRKIEAVLTPATKRKSSRLSSEHISTTITLSSSSVVLPTCCIVCKKLDLYYTDHHDKKRKKQELSLCQTLDGGLLRLAAEDKNDESILVHIRNKDFVAIEVRYHRNCYNEYTKSLRSSPSSSSTTSATSNLMYELSFETFCSKVIDHKIIGLKKVYRLNDLTDYFIKTVKRVENFDAGKYKSSRLKGRLIKRYPDLVFHRPSDRRQSELVFLGNEEGGAVILDDYNSEIDSQDSQQSQSETESNDDISRSFNISHSVFHQVCMQIKGALDEARGIKNGWPPLSSDFTVENIESGIPPILYNFLALILGYTDEVSYNSYVTISHNLKLKVLSLGQDLLLVYSKGKTLTYKSLALAAAVKQMSGSSKVVRMLNNFGHCCSQITLRGFESAVATLNSDHDNAVVPKNVQPNIFTTLVYDNADFLEETLSGSGSTHVTHGICIQKQSNSRNSETNFVAVSKRIRTVNVQMNEIPAYFLGKKVSLNVAEYFEQNHAVIIDTDSYQDYYRSFDLAYITCKLPQLNSTGVLPCWTGCNTIRASFNSTNNNMSTISYLPIINAPVTDISTIHEVLRTGINIANKLSLHQIVMVFDEAVYAKIQMVRWKHVEFVDRIVVRLGDFHMIMSFMTAISKIFQDAGLQVSNIFLHK